MFKNEHQLGEIITFAFEDNTYFYHFTDLLKSGKTSEAKGIISRIKENIWLHHDEERRRYWRMAELGLELLKLTDVPIKSCSSLKIAIELYTQQNYRIDQLQRRFEKQALEVMEENSALSELKNLVRNRYSQFSEKYVLFLQEDI